MMFRNRFRRALRLGTVGAVLGTTVGVLGLGGAGVANAAAVPPINTSDRAAVVAAYNTYSSGLVTSSGWTGNRATCTPGTLAANYREQAYTSMNYFRAMAGLSSSITENTTFRDQAQAAALINALNPGQPDPHNPQPTVTCYSAAGATGAANSNLAWQNGLGMNSYEVVKSWVDDEGVTSMGHRAGILHPPALQSGYGDVPQGGGSDGGQAMWVFDQPFVTWPTLSTPGGGVAWPPAGFVPYQLVFPTWTFMSQGADMTNAAVTVTQNGNPVATTITHRRTAGAMAYPASTLAFKPTIPLSNYNAFQAKAHSQPTQDTTYNVSITGIPGKGTISYSVTVIDPAAAVNSPPSAPTNLTLATQGTNVNLSWTDTSTNENGFEIQRARWVAGVWTEFAQLPSVGANTTTSTDTNVTPGFYAYLVRAVNGSGNSSYAITTIQHSNATQVPPAPTNLVPASSGNNVVLNWTDNSSDEWVQEVGRARYNYTTQTWGEWAFFLADRNATTYTDTSVPDGQYAYLVRATNKIGASSWVISTVTHVNSPGVPAAPTNLTATPAAGNVTLNWTDNSSNETVYEIQRARFVANAWSEWTSFAIDKNSTTFTNQSVAPAGQYAYLVRATNPGGSSAWVTVVTNV